jgi:hypothetical protein
MVWLRLPPSRCIPACSASSRAARRRAEGSWREARPPVRRGDRGPGRAGGGHACWGGPHPGRDSQGPRRHGDLGRQERVRDLLLHQGPGQPGHFDQPRHVVRQEHHLHGTRLDHGSRKHLVRTRAATMTRRLGAGLKVMSLTDRVSRVSRGRAVRLARDGMAGRAQMSSSLAGTASWSSRCWISAW